MRILIPLHPGQADADANTVTNADAYADTAPPARAKQDAANCSAVHTTKRIPQRSRCSPRRPPTRS